MVLGMEPLNAIDNGYNPFDDKVFQTIFLIQIRVHVLLHGFSCLMAVFAFLVEFYLLAVHVLDCVFQLFQCQVAMLQLTQ